MPDYKPDRVVIELHDLDVPPPARSRTNTPRTIQIPPVSMHELVGMPTSFPADAPKGTPPRGTPVPVQRRGFLIRIKVGGAWSTREIRSSRDFVLALYIADEVLP